MKGKMQNINRKTCGINGIFQFCNLVVACLIISGLFNKGLSEHPYMDWLTLVLGLALCLQTHIVLYLEKRNPDPFLLLMVYLLTIFYSLRIFTLLHYPFQPVFLRFSYSPSDSNYALLYILVANIFIYSGFHWIKFKGILEIDTSTYRPIKPRLMVEIFFISLLFSLFIQNHLPLSIEKLINLIYNNFFTPQLILLVLAVYVIIYHKSLPRLYLYAVLAGAAILVALQTLAFSRSGLLTFLDNLLILVLALLPKVQIPRKFVYIGFSLLPIFFVTAIAFFALSTWTRTVKGDMGGNLSERIELAQTSYLMLKDDSHTESYLRNAFARAGYFDYSAEIIAHKEQYSGVFTLSNYTKSIVDNVISPGFDVFDMPRISSCLKYIYSSLGEYSRREERVAGHSDHIGLYGEMYALFGNYSFLVLFFFAYCIKKVFKTPYFNSPFPIALQRVFVLIIFYRFMNSFGIDWILFDALILFVVFIMFNKLFFREYCCSVSYQENMDENTLTLIAK